MNPINKLSVQKDVNHVVFTAPTIQEAAPANQVPNMTDTFEVSAQPSSAPKKTVFARMNESWFTKTSNNVHAFFQEKPEDWQAYHATFRDARKTWEATPADEMIRLYTAKNGLTIGDFGCGEGMIGEALANKHTVHSFDHVAANPHVTACDIAHVPLDNGVLDVAIFSLALMGENFTQYINEAHRALAVGGTLHVIEMSRRFTDKDGFIQGLESKGFKVTASEDMWKFTHVVATKISAESHPEIALKF